MRSEDRREAEASTFQYRFDFRYPHGIKRSEVALFDVRDVALERHVKFRHGDRLKRNDGRYFTVIGVKLSEEGRPKVYTQADDDAGAAFHNGDFSEFEKVGSMTVAQADPTSASPQCGSSERDLMRLLKDVKTDGLKHRHKKKLFEILEMMKCLASKEATASTNSQVEKLDLQPEFQVRLRKSHRVA